MIIDTYNFFIVNWLPLMLLGGAVAIVIADAMDESVVLSYAKSATAMDTSEAKDEWFTDYARRYHDDFPVTPSGNGGLMAA